MANIRIEGLDELQQKLGKIAAAEVMRRAMRKGLLYLRSKVDRLEPKIPGAFGRTATPGQRRAFWAKVNQGLASVGANGYMRTGQTARAWSESVDGDGLRGELSNNAPGAQWVFGATTQQPFHSHQPRVDQVAAREAAAVSGIFSAEIGEAINE